MGSCLISPGTSSWSSRRVTHPLQGDRDGGQQRSPVRVGLRRRASWGVSLQDPESPPGVGAWLGAPKSVFETRIPGPSHAGQCGEDRRESGSWQRAQKDLEGQTPPPERGRCGEPGVSAQGGGPAGCLRPCPHWDGFLFSQKHN